MYVKRKAVDPGLVVRLMFFQCEFKSKKLLLADGNRLSSTLVRKDLVEFVFWRMLDVRCDCLTVRGYQTRIAR